MPYKFDSKALKILNNKIFGATEKKIGFISENFSDFLEDEASPVEMLQDLAFWLISEVNQSDSDLKMCAQPLYELVKANLERLKALKATSKDVVALFLVEILRCYNFAKHDSNVVREFARDIFPSLGYGVDGDVDYCIINATFGDLTYVDGTVLMKQ
ncbi:hypothetical protein [Marinibactrum halimedae]|uniref:Uncharacterized protein n=1 Tax=Marinibactrum halimedae TaxID=1444977 RepID=A0AA37WLR5_9GAMM|nr:hypothetical protein [Marinibactrum halimedae]MCD9458752.1 hypothetical protein [Marinibactrum halimedae]GLS25310.1 hypothetical protein GCM10007877_10240 [Marinibactrum halimedae]